MGKIRLKDFINSDNPKRSEYRRTVAIVAERGAKNLIKHLRDIAIKMNPSLLLPREKYEEESRKYGGEYSTFEIKTDKQVLFYFGANHSRDPKNPQYPALKGYWQKFLQATEGKEKIILVEGGLRKLEKDEESAITKSGSEGGLITFLAHQANTSIICPDISAEELMEKLPDQNKDEVLLYWFLGWLDNFQRHSEPKPDFEKSALLYCERAAKRKIWEGVDVSLPRLKQIYKQVIGREFNEKASPNNFVNPNKAETPINKIARAQSELRDTNIVSEIERYWNEGKSIFAVFGRGHLIIERPALEAILK